VKKEAIEEILRRVRKGDLTVAGAMKRLKNWPVEKLPFAAIDHHRSLRQGLPEVVFCEGKTPEQVAAIAARIYESGENLLATRADAAVFAAVRDVLPRASYNGDGRVITVLHPRRKRPVGRVLVMTAGTSDIPVAEEAAATITAAGSAVSRAYDTGVAGLHRLVAHQGLMSRARVIVVVAGMDGALPSVVGGLVDKPVVAVPTSIGYGAGQGGITPLLTMLNSCAAGIAVVNIDNGFGAGVLAHRINILGCAGKGKGR
jgi:NCAIR mutase (PurE)-related protein